MPYCRAAGSGVRDAVRAELRPRLVPRTGGRGAGLSHGLSTGGDGGGLPCAVRAVRHPLQAGHAAPYAFPAAEGPGCRCYRSLMGADQVFDGSEAARYK
jgi:hypothetical protein